MAATLLGALLACAAAGAGAAGPCIGDTDGDGDTDVDDLVAVITSFGETCPGDGCDADLDGSGVVDLEDLLLVICDWQCPPPLDVEGTLLHEIVAVDNSSANGQDGFGAGTTHFTLDLRVTASLTAGWGSTSVSLALTEPGVELFHSNFFQPGCAGINPPNAIIVDTDEFDTYVCLAMDIPPGGLGTQPDLLFSDPTPTCTAVETTWAGLGPLDGTVARFTILTGGAPGLVPVAVPAGTGGAAPIIGTITGVSRTNECGSPDIPFAFDLINGNDVMLSPPVTVAVDAPGEPVFEVIGDFALARFEDAVVVVPTGDPTPGSVQVFVNQGVDQDEQWQGFVGNPPVTVGEDPSAAALADLDGDGFLDVAVANRGDGTITVLLNDGSGQGTFLPAQTVKLEGAPALSAIAAASFPGDGHVDLIVADTDSDTVSILSGDGRGGFVMFGAPLEVGDDPGSICPEDLDNDRCLDLVVANFASNTVSIFLGLGGGNTTPITVPVGAGPVDLAVADLDGDLAGNLDIATANRTAGTITPIVNNGDGTFTPQADVAVGTALRSIDARPIDCGDSFDLAVVSDDPNFGSAVFVLVNATVVPGTVELGEPAVFPIDGAAPSFVATGELDLDGDFDLVTVNTNTAEGPATGSLSAFLNVSCTCPDPNGDGTVDVDDLIEVIIDWDCADPPGPCPGDVNGDGIVDVADLVELILSWGKC